MTEILTILFFTIIQFIIGFNCLSLFKVKLMPWIMVSLSVLLGVFIFSFVVFILILLKVPLTSFNVFTSIIITAVLSLLSFKTSISNFKNLISTINFKPKLYELPAIILIGLIIFVSAWRCFYFPPTPRDLTSGPEVIAEYAVKEKTISNSVFTVNLESTNNQFKSPFITTLQIIYKYAGFPFGQIWLSTIFLFFIIFLYNALANHLHKVIAGFLVLWFLCIPEMFSYTIMALFDYSNAVFFTIGLYFLLEYSSKENNRNYISLSALFFAISVYIRSETLVLVALVTLCYLIMQLIKKENFKKIFINSIILGSVSLIIYFLSSYIFLNYYLPQKYDINGLVNNNLGNLNPFFTRFSEIFSKLLFGTNGSLLYGNFIYLFIVLFIVDIYFIIKQKNILNNKSLKWAFYAFLLIFGLSFLGYLLPLMDLLNSTKRGLFKLFPILLLYFMHNNTLQYFSKKLTLTK